MDDFVWRPSKVRRGRRRLALVCVAALAVSVGCLAALGTSGMWWPMLGWAVAALFEGLLLASALTGPTVRVAGGMVRVSSGLHAVAVPRAMVAAAGVSQAVVLGRRVDRLTLSLRPSPAHGVAVDAIVLGWFASAAAHRDDAGGVPAAAARLNAALSSG